MHEKLKQTIIQVLKVAFAFALIAYLVHTGALDFKVLAGLATPLRLSILILSSGAGIFINNYRWRVLLSAQGFENSSLRLAPLTLIGIFFNYAMPGGVGGDVVKGYYLLRHHPEQKVAAAISIFMDRMVGFFMMIVTAAAAVFLNLDKVQQNAQLKGLAGGVGLVFLAFLVFFILAFSRSLKNAVWLEGLVARLPAGKRLWQVYTYIHSYRQKPGALAWSLVLSFFSQSCMVFFVYMIGQWMGITDLPLQAYFFAVPLGTVALALPVAPAGVGVGQMVFLFLFNLCLGRPTPLGPTAITSYQVISLCWGLVGAYFYLRSKRPELAGAPSKVA